MFESNDLGEKVVKVLCGNKVDLLDAVEAGNENVVDTDADEIAK